MAASLKKKMVGRGMDFDLQLKHIFGCTMKFLKETNSKINQSNYVVGPFKETDLLMLFS